MLRFKSDGNNNAINCKGAASDDHRWERASIYEVTRRKDEVYHLKADILGYAVNKIKNEVTAGRQAPMTELEMKYSVLIIVPLPPLYPL